jgi:hypothetical protein
MFSVGRSYLSTRSLLMCSHRLATAILLVLLTCLCEGALGKGKGGGGGGKGFGGGRGGSHGPRWSGSSSHGGGAKQASKERRVTKDKVANQQSPRTVTTSDSLAANKKEKQLQLFQQQRDKKLAQAEHLRQIAERNGNANLAANADRMEAQALQQYADKASRLEKFGITDPLLNPDQPPVKDDLLGGDLLGDVASP